ncbi:MAG: PhoU domain-containing protein [Bacteroidota bacterium]
MSLLDFFQTQPSALVAQSRTHLVEMLRTTQHMFEVAASTIQTAAPPSLNLEAADEGVNAREQQVRRALLQHVATTSTDLPHSLTLISVVQDAERCGDLAKSLAKAAALTDQRTASALFAMLESAMSSVTALFPKVRSAFERDDKAAAAAAMTAAQELNDHQLKAGGFLMRPERHSTGKHAGHSTSKLSSPRRRK